MACRFHWLLSSTSRMIRRSGSSSACFSVRPATGSSCTPAAAGDRGRGQIVDADRPTLAQQHGSLDHVGQFAHVAGPADSARAPSWHSSVKPGTCLPHSSHTSLRKCAASSGMSATRSRSGGSSILMTLTR